MAQQRATPGDSGPEVPTSIPAVLADLRADLGEAGYTTDRVADLLGPLASGALHRDQPLPARRVLSASTEAAATLVRLFVLGEAVPIGDIDTALPRTGSQGLVALGLASQQPERTDQPDSNQQPGNTTLHARADLRPYGEERHDWWVASDLSEAALGGALPIDHVLGIGGASTTLASWTPRPRVARALDVGTGCGVQALHLLGHVEEVVATDLSQRALAFARFNAELNGIPLQTRVGSLLEPVAGEQFDLVVSNPPFVITPRRPDVPRYEYRDGGASGDALVAGLVRDLPSVLAPGGIAQLLGNWELRAGEDWGEHVAAWLAGTGLDAWVIQREVQDVAEYAETWIRDGGHRPGSPEHDALYAAWLEDFATRGIESVGFGIITLQRPTSQRETFLDLDEVRGPVAQPVGAAILAGLQARTWLAEHSDTEVLDTPWSVADDITEERIGRPGATDPMIIQLRQGGGLGRTIRLDTVAAGLVGACDGDLTAHQILAGIAVLTDQDVHDLVATAVPTVRSLVADGLLR